MGWGTVKGGDRAEGSNEDSIDIGGRTTKIKLAGDGKGREGSLCDKTSAYQNLGVSYNKYFYL